jgi:hypothetical protein
MKTMLLSFLGAVVCATGAALAQAPDDSHRVPLVSPEPIGAAPVAQPCPSPQASTEGQNVSRACPAQQGNGNGAAAEGRYPGPVKRFQDYYYGGSPWRCTNNNCCNVPLGARVYDMMSVQINNGLAAQRVLYHYDFCDSQSAQAAELNVHGRKRLLTMARVCGCGGSPIVIEASPCEAGLDAARLQSVVALLQLVAPGTPRESVVIGDPQPRGLGGVEATQIYENMLRETKPSNGTSSASAVQTIGALLGNH